MTYIIYADLMLIWNTIINFAAISITSILIGNDLKHGKNLLWALITGFIIQVEYIATIELNIYIYHIFYVITYLIMINVRFKAKAFKVFIYRNVFLISAMTIMQGVLSIISPLHIINLKSSSILIILCVLLCSCIFSFSKYEKKENEKIYPICLTINQKKVNTKGYLDTGNCLMDPYTGYPVIVLDYDLLTNIYGKSVQPYIESYHKEGIFPYEEMKMLCHIDFYPIAYKTISSELSIMPAFKISSLTFSDTEKKERNIVCGISRYKLKNNSDYQVLLNESIKPYREENSND